MYIHVDKSEQMELPQKSLMAHGNSKIIFALGSYEYLERLEDKIRKCLFLC